MAAVTLSKTKKKPGSERKGKVLTEIKRAVDQYSSAYVFTYDNMRNQKLKDLREQLKSSSRYPLSLLQCISLQMLWWTCTSFDSAMVFDFTLPIQAMFTFATNIVMLHGALETLNLKAWNTLHLVQATMLVKPLKHANG